MIALFLHIWGPKDYDLRSSIRWTFTLFYVCLSYFQYQQGKWFAANQKMSWIGNFMKRQLWLAEITFSFLVGKRGSKATLYTVRALKSNWRVNTTGAWRKRQRDLLRAKTRETWWWFCAQLRNVRQVGRERERSEPNLWIPEEPVPFCEGGIPGFLQALLWALPPRWH